MTGKIIIKSLSLMSVMLGVCRATEPGNLLPRTAAQALNVRRVFDWPFPADLRKYRNAAQYMELMKSRFSDPYFTHVHFTKALYTLTQRRYIGCRRYARAHSTWLSQWCRHSYNHLVNFAPVHLSRCVFALGVLGTAGAHVWTQEWLRCSMGKFEEYKPVDFAMTMKGMVMSGVSPGNDWLEAMYLHSGSKLGKFKVMERVNMLHDIAVSGFSHDRCWIRRWFWADPDVKDDYNARDSSLFLHAVALTDMDVPQEWFSRFKARLPAMTAPKDKHRAHLFNAWAAVCGKEAMRVPVRITDADRRFYRGRSAGLSGLERDVLEVLRLRVKEQDILVQHWLDDILSKVDFYIMQAKLVIQADGPVHYLAKGVLNPQSMLQTKILEGLGYRVRRVSYIAWNKPGAKDLFLREIEEDLAVISSHDADQISAETNAPL